MTAMGRGARRRFVQRRKALGFTQESLAELLNVERSTVVRWEAGKSEPLAWLWPKLASALKVTPEQLTDLLAGGSTDAPAEAPVDNDAQMDDDLDRRGALKVLAVGAASFGSCVVSVRDVVLDAARSSAMLRASVETPGISQFAMTGARQRLYRLATDYALASDPALILSELVELRDELHTALTTRNHHPNDARDLYVLLGAACVLLSSISHDLSEPLAGMTQATTAETFAELSGHHGLLTWVYCTKAMIASWWATPTEVLHHIQKAHAVGAFGIPAVRLAGLQARALAQLGKRTEAIAVLHAAQDQRDKFGEHNDLQELGEVFTFPLPRQHYYNAATHLHLHNWMNVERETTTVGDLYGTPSMGRAWPVTLTLTRIYQSRARLQEHGPEGALDALRPVFDMPAELRLPQTSQALSGLRNELELKPFAALPAARDLSDAIRSFQSSTRSP